MKYNLYHWHICPVCGCLWSCDNIACHDFKWPDMECPDCQFSKYGKVTLGN